MAADDHSSAEIRLPPPPSAAVTETVAAMERRFQSHQRATSEASAANSSAKLSRLRSVLRRTGSRDDKSVSSVGFSVLFVLFCFSSFYHSWHALVKQVW